MKKRGLLVVVSSPSGGGKGTILKELFRRNANLKMSVSATTRAPRPGEEHGVHYYFITKDEFKTNIENHAMLEYAEYCDNFYGTPKAPVEKWLEEGHDVVLEIEVQGGRQIKKVAPDCVSLFILPPSLKVLEKRLRGRGTETEEVIEKRLAAAADEIRCVKDYDYAVINDTVEQAVLDIEAILAAENIIKTPHKSYYSVVIAVAKRAREITQEAEDNNEIIVEKPVDLAVQDFVDEKYKIIEPDEIDG